MNNVIEEKTLVFANSIVKLYKFLAFDKNEQVLSKQILKSGTSIGANVAEAQDAQSKNDFISKMSIALKESNETKYWLKVLKNGEFISQECFDNLYAETCEIHDIISSIIITTKNKYKM